MIEVRGAMEVAAAFGAQADAVAAKASLLAERGAQELAGLVSSRAPRRTGAYAGSWRGDGAEAVSAAPQAHRLEAGFERTDSLGRRYHQPAFPHIGPAVSVFVPLFTEQVGAVVVDALR